MAQYPNAMPDLRAVQNDPGVAYDPLQTNVVFAEDVNNIAAEILAIATELGSLPKGSFADVKTRLADMTSKTATAQSTANTKAKKYDNALRLLGWAGASADRTINPTTEGTAYDVLGYSGSTPHTLHVELAEASKFNGIIIEFSCIGQIEVNNWIEYQIHVDGASVMGWTKLCAPNSQLMYAAGAVGTSLDAGNHEITVKVRRNFSGTTKIRTVNPVIKCWQKVDD